MPASQAVIGYGAKFFIGDSASPTVYTQIAELAMINVTGFTIQEVDVTNLNSPNRTEESTPGMLKPGNIEISGNYIGDTSQSSFDALAAAGTIFPWKATAPATAVKVLTETGTGYFTKIEVGPFETDKVTKITATIRITGPITKVVA
jgi:hypothetical protein